jgi:hypothetical protein
MPQNHNNWNRRRNGAGLASQNLHANPQNNSGNEVPHGLNATLRDIGTATVQHTAPFHQVYPVPSRDDNAIPVGQTSSKSTGMRPNPSNDARIIGDAVRFQFGPRASNPTSHQSSTSQPPAQVPLRAGTETLQIAAKPSTAVNNTKKKTEQASLRKVPYSKAHLQQSKQPIPKMEPESAPNAGVSRRRDGAGTPAQFASLMPPLSPLGLSRMPRRWPDLYTYPPSPTLEQVRQLRVDEQDQVFAQIGRDFSHMVNTRSDRAAADKAPAHKQKEEATKHNSSKLPTIKVPSTEWSKPLHAIVKPPHSALSERRAMRPETRSRPNPQRAEPAFKLPDEQKDMEKLNEAMHEINLFQKIASTPLPSRSMRFQDERIAVPKPLPVNATKPVRTNERTVDAQANTAKQAPKPAVVEEESNRSEELIASFASEDFEEIDVPDIEESEHNGKEWKWYKGFRR